MQLAILLMKYTIKYVCAIKKIYNYQVFRNYKKFKLQKCRKSFINIFFLTLKLKQTLNKQYTNKSANKNKNNNSKKLGK